MGSLPISSQQVECHADFAIRSEVSSRKPGWGSTCWRTEVKAVNLAVNTIYNHWRFEDVWLDR